MLSVFQQPGSSKIILRNKMLSTAVHWTVASIVATYPSRAYNMTSTVLSTVTHILESIWTNEQLFYHWEYNTYINTTYPECGHITSRGLRGPFHLEKVCCDNKSRHHLPWHIYQSLWRLDSLAFHRIGPVMNPRWQGHGAWDETRQVKDRIECRKYTMK